MKFAMVAVLVMGIAVTVAQAQAPASGGAQATGAAPAPYRGPARDIEGLYRASFQQIVRAATTMPAEDFHFKPREDAPSFANLLKQAIDGEHAACDEVNRTPASERAKVPEETATKDEFMAALQAASTACERSYADMTVENFTELRLSGNTQRARISILAWNYAHNSLLFGSMLEYLGEKGLKIPPPAARGGR